MCGAVSVMVCYRVGRRWEMEGVQKFLCNLIFECFSQTCSYNSNFLLISPK